MSESDLNLTMDVEVIDDQIEAIFHELDLALQWKRPSILFAIYNTAAIRNSAQEALEKLILESGQRVVHYQIEYEENLDLPQFISEITLKQEAIFYIDPLNSDGKDSKIGNLITMLNSCRGYLVDNLIRVVFWLTETEALSVAHQAPDFWASRHRVFEFLVSGDEVEQEPDAEPVVQSVQAPSMSIAKDIQQSEDGMQGESAIVMDLTEGDDPSVSGIHLLLMMGVSSWKDGNLDKAGESLQAALEIAKKTGNKSHQAMCYKAIALVKSDSGKDDEAIEAYKRVVDLGPENVTIWNNIGSLYQKTGRNDQALAAFKSALKKDPNDPVSWHGLGNVYSSTGRLDEAITCYRKAIQFNAGYMTPWVKLAEVLHKQNRYQDALYAYMRTVEMDKKNVHAWSEIGSIYFKAGSYEQAVGAYKKALDLGMDSPTFHNNLADALTHTGNYMEAIPHFHKAIEAVGDEGEKAALWNRLGDVHRRMNEYESAVSAYETADKLLITLAEAESEAMLEKSKEGAEGKTDGQKPTAVTGSVMEKPVQAAVQSPVVKHIGGNANKDVDEVLSPTAASLSIENAALWARLGGTYLKTGTLDRAVDALLKAINLDPGNGKACFLLGQAYAQKIDLVQAVTYYKKSLEMLSDQVDQASVFCGLGDAYRQQKEYANALAAFEEAVALDPENSTILSRLNQFQDDLDRISTSGSNAGSQSETPAPEKTAQDGQAAEPAKGTAEGEVLPGEKIDPANPGAIDLDNANVWNELGNIFTKFKTYDEAISAYYKAIEKNPDFGWAYCNLALVFSRQGKFEAAIELYQKSIDLLWTNKDKVVAWNRLGDAYRQSGNYNDAIDSYQNADILKKGSADSSGGVEAGFEQLLPHFVS